MAMYRVWFLLHFLLQAHFRIISEWVLYSVLHSPERSFHTKVAETGWRFPADFPSTPLNPSVPNFTKFMIFAGLPDDQETSKPLLVRAVKACCRHSADCTVSGDHWISWTWNKTPRFTRCCELGVPKDLLASYVHPAVVSKVVVFVFARGMVHHSPELVDTGPQNASKNGTCPSWRRFHPVLTKVLKSRKIGWPVATPKASVDL